MEERRVVLQDNPLGLVPEQVLVIETVGSIEGFVRAVEKIEGLEWLAEYELDDLPPAYGFEDRSKSDKHLRGQLFLVMTDQKALDQLQNLFNRWRGDRGIAFPHGLAPLRHAFHLLHTIRRWNANDRIRGTGIIENWRFRLENDQHDVPFEAEFWFRRNAEQRRNAESELREVITALRGAVIGQCVIPDIAYHAMLGRLPPARVHEIIDGSEASQSVRLLQCEGVMHLRPVGQCAVPARADSDADLVGEDDVARMMAEQEPLDAPPVVALFDGMPLTAHKLLDSRVIVDDPDGYEAEYQAHERVHATETASIVCHGDIGSATATSEPAIRPVYVRPIMKPSRGFGLRFPERIPEDVLPVDLIHRSVRRLFEPEDDQPPAAPTIRFINLSVGDPDRPFALEMSAWARLLDWLAWKYQVLFVVSAGNHMHDIELQIPQGSLSALTPEERERQILRSVAEDTRNRRLLSPAETLNGLTIGALHQDEWAGSNGGLIDPFTCPGVPSVVSAHGPGYRRAVKPDAFFPGGRQCLSEKPRPGGRNVTLEVPGLASAPGQRVATPGRPGQLDRTRYTRGTSNAAALASRGAEAVYGMIDRLRRQPGVHIPEEYDVVLTKALLVHSAAWGDALGRYEAALKTNENSRTFRDYAGRFLGYGGASPTRVTSCTEERITVVGFGKLDDGEGHVFSLPLPPCLSGAGESRRLTITLAWLSPVNPSHRAYRVAQLWFDPRNNIAPQRLFADHRAAQRGTVQHEVLEGERATVFQDGEAIAIQVNCRADAGEVPAPIPYGLAISLEVVEGVQPRLMPLPIYQEVRERLAIRVPVQPTHKP